MNTEQYHKLIGKFYDGETSLAEEKLLKESEHLSVEDSIYLETLKTEKTDNLQLNFEQFLALANKEKNIAAPLKSSNFKWVWLAASLIFLFSIGAVLLNNDKAKAKNELATSEVYKKEKTEIMNENSYEPVVEVTKPEVQKMANNEEVLDKILSKKSRMKKKVTTRFVDNSKPLKSKEDTEYESGYVIINGHKITNEKDAIDVTKYSFQILANNMSQSINQADAVSTLKMED